MSSTGASVTYCLLSCSKQEEDSDTGEPLKRQRAPTQKRWAPSPGTALKDKYPCGYFSTSRSRGRGRSVGFSEIAFCLSVRVRSGACGGSFGFVLVAHLWLDCLFFYSCAQSAPCTRRRSRVTTKERRPVEIFTILGLRDLVVAADELFQSTHILTRFLGGCCGHLPRWSSDSVEPLFPL